MISCALNWPYAALAIITHNVQFPVLHMWIIFRHPMDQTVEPPWSVWIPWIDGDQSPVTNAFWSDAYTYKLNLASPVPPIFRALLKYDGPNQNLRTTWHKQWEPWNYIPSIAV